MESDSKIPRSILQAVKDAITEAERRGYAQGVRDTMEKIKSVVDVNGDIHGESAAPNAMQSSPKPVRGGRKRAPKGLADKVIRRALTKTPGLTPVEIEQAAKGDELEEMIKSTSFRSALRKGLQRKLYREEGGKWFLVDAG